MRAHALAVEHPEVAAPSPFQFAEEQFGAIKSRLVSSEARVMIHSDLEKLLEVEGRELMRRLL